MEYRLDEIFELQMGKTPARKNINYWEKGTYKWISIADLSNCDKYISKTTELITSAAVNESNIKIIPANTVIMSFKLSIGKVAITSKEMYSNEAIMAFIDKNKVEVLPEYFYYLLRSIDWNKGLNRAVMGATLNKESLSKIKVNIVDVDKQSKIVKILSILDDIILNRKRQLKLLDLLVKAKFNEMFGDPVTNNLNWPVQSMNMVAPIVNYKGEVSDACWLLNLDKVEADTGRIIGYEIVRKTQIGESVCAFNPDNILYSKLRPYLNKVVLPDQIGYATSEMLPLKPDNKFLNREFLAWLLRSVSFVNWASYKVSGAKMPRLNMSDFKSFKVIIPDMNLQIQFRDFTFELNNLQLNIEKSIEMYSSLKNSLMQKYFRGE